jgi:MoaA/NifB/PqqE/SkfB family radical SAM enzyme
LAAYIRNIIEEGGSKLRSITFSGGEPLLHPELETIVSMYSDACEERTVITNGILLTEGRLQSLREAGVSKFRIGVDSLIGPSRPS